MREEDARGRRKAAQLVSGAARVEFVELRDHEAVFGELDRGLEDVAQAHRAVALQRRRPTLEGAGYDRRVVAGVEVVEGHRAGRRGGGGLAHRIEPDNAVLLRQVDHHESAEATDPRHVGLGDVERRGRGHDGVDGVAALHHDRGAGQRRVVVGRGSDSAAAPDAAVGDSEVAVVGRPEGCGRVRGASGWRGRVTSEQTGAGGSGGRGGRGKEVSTFHGGTPGCCLSSPSIPWCPALSPVSTINWTKSRTGAPRGHASVGVLN